MSYAAVTAKNAHQSPEEARANPVPELEHSLTETSSLIDVDSPHISSVPSTFDSQDVQTTTQAARIDREHDAQDAAADARAKAHRAADKAKSTAKRGGQRARANADNPVVVGNAVVSAALLGVLGYAGYRKWRAGEFGWKVVGVGAAVLGVFGMVDFYASQYLFKKYPAKK